MDKFISNNYNNIPFEYTNDGVKTNPDFIIPEKSYKFYELNERNVEALSENYLFASHPYLLNDSFDSSDNIFDFTEIEKAFFRGFFITYLKEKYCEKDISEYYKKDKLQNFRGFRETFISSLSNKLGTISLTIKCKNALMWSHYTSEKGFCIEFETSELLNEYNILNADIKKIFFRPMQYVEEIELLKITGREFEGTTVPFLYMTTVKNKEWEYENEYRLNIYKKDMDVPFNRKYSHLPTHKGGNDRCFRYKKSAIKSIILGQNFFSNDNLKITQNGILEIEITEKSIFVENFISLLFENYNDKIYIIGETQENNLLQKGIARIFFERIKLNMFRICYADEKYLL